jgi:drug/metabolite transporter (DMT)-like permease
MNLNHWIFFVIIGCIFFTIVNVLRKYIFETKNIDGKKSFFYILIGLFLGSFLFILFYLFKNDFNKKSSEMIHNIFKSKNNLSYIAFIICGGLFILAFSCVHNAHFLIDNVSYIPLSMGGITTILTFLGSIIFLNAKLNFVKIVGLITILSGMYLITLK